MQGSKNIERIERKDRAGIIPSPELVENRKFKMKRVRKQRDLARRKALGEKVTAMRGGNKL